MRSSLRLAVWPRLPLIVAVLALVVSLSTKAAAQAVDPAPGLTAEALIGDSVADTGSDRYDFVREAIQRFKNRDALSARTFLERALEKDDKLPPVGVLLAKMQLLAGNGAGVRPALEQAVQEDSANDPEPFLLLAEEALAGGRTIEADALFDKAAALIDKYEGNAKRKRQFVIRASRGRAIVADRRGKWELAEEALVEWLEQAPDDPAALTTMGQVHFMLDKPTEGYNSFVAAKEKNDQLPNPYVSAGLMYERKEDTTLALQSFERAYAEDKKDETTVVSYGQALVRADQVDKALQVLSGAQRDAPESANVWLLSGVAARMAGDPAKAEEMLVQALTLSPSNRDVLNQLAQTLADSTEEGDRARALQFANINALLNQNNPDVNITLAWALFQNNQGAQASQALTRALQGGVLSPDANFLLAKMLLTREDKANAKRLLETALENKQGIFVQKEQAETLLKTL